ncbi:MAG: hypothetical protein Kow0042_06320 [Calditrichia bacterium]
MRNRDWEKEDFVFVPNAARESHIAGAFHAGRSTAPGVGLKWCGKVPIITLLLKKRNKNSPVIPINFLSEFVAEECKYID